LWFALLLLMGIQAVFSAEVVKISDPNWYFTEYNWVKAHDNSSARSANPGAYFKVGFTGTSCAITIDKPALGSAYMNLRYSVDGRPFEHVTLPTTSTTITLGTGLDKSANHDVILYILNSLQSQDRWLTPLASVSVTGLLLDAGAKTLPATLRPKRMLAFWDSIGEGVRDLGSGGSDLTDNDSTASSMMVVAAGLSAELSLVAFGRQGYTIYGNGNVAPLFIPGNDTISAWDKFDAKNSRLNSRKELDPNPDYIFCGHATNDRGVASDIVQRSAVGWLTAQRAASPKSWIFIVVPYGGFHREAVTNAYKEYKGKSNDAAVILIDLGDAGSEGLNVGHPSLYGSDGLHPTALRNGGLGAMLVAAAVPHIQK